MQRPSDRVWLGTIALLFGVYAGFFIYNSSFSIEGQRYFSLFDDAMVSMRYAKNLARGEGLVWNPGERVEGFTSPLWVLYMAAWHLLPLPASKISLVIQLSGAVALLANLFVVANIARVASGDARPVVLGATFLTAFYYPLAFWALNGMEVSVLTLLVSGAVLWALRGFTSRSRIIGFYCLLGVGTLVRLDMAVPFLSLLGFVAWRDRAWRREHLLVGLSVLLVFLGGHTLLRYAYYGDLLPNTYYDKLAGFPASLRMARGLLAFVAFADHMNPLLFAVPVFVVLLRRDRVTALLACVFLGQVAYSVYVGGDVWEGTWGSNRFYSVAMPLFLVLMCDGLHAALERAAAPSPGTLPARLTRSVGLGALVWGLSYTGALDEWGTRSLLPLGLSIALSLGFFAIHRRPALHGVALSMLVILSLANLNGHLTAVRDTPPSALWVRLRPSNFATSAARMLVVSRWIERNTSPDARVAVSWAGTVPYFTERRMLDLLGKTDPVIARKEMRSPWDGVPPYVSFLPGHMKWDYAYSLGEKRPDVVVELWPGECVIRPDEEPPRDAKPFLADYDPVVVGDFKLYLRRGSNAVTRVRDARS